MGCGVSVAVTMHYTFANPVKTFKGAPDRYHPIDLEFRLWTEGCLKVKFFRRMRQPLFEDG